MHDTTNVVVVQEQKSVLPKNGEFDRENEPVGKEKFDGLVLHASYAL